MILKGHGRRKDDEMVTSEFEGKAIYFDDKNQVWRFRLTDKIHVPVMRPEGPYKQGLIDLINHLPKGLEMVEIGCYAGESTILFADRMKSVLAIDPWEDGYPSMNEAVKHTPMASVRKAFDERTKPFDNIMALRSTSERVHGSLLKKFDLVYFDGNHLPKEVRKDITLWKTRIKPGGWIGGHDYNDVNWGPGVSSAVEDLLGTPDKVFADGSWIMLLAHTKDAMQEWEEQQAEAPRS